MSQETVKEAKKRMEKVEADLRAELATLRTGRASISLLDHVRFDYYGTPTPLKEAAKLSVTDPTTLSIQPFDPNILGEIERAIRASDLGLNPANDGKIIRVPIPSLTEERRKEIVKQVKHKGEEEKLAIRNERRDAKELIEVAKKDGDISEDEAKKALEKMQKSTDEGVKKVEEIVAAKEKDVMQV